MTAFRLFLIIVIFCAVSVAWLILGGTIEYRTHALTTRMSEEVNAMWGPSGLVQPAPTPNPLESDIQVAFDHENRYKGLIWFSTYTVDFTATYKVAATESGKATAPSGLTLPRASGGPGEGRAKVYPAMAATPRSTFRLPLPAEASVIENLAVTLDGEPLDLSQVKHGNSLVVELPGNGHTHTITVTYRTYGRDYWLYDLSQGGQDTSMVRKLTLTATTDFRDIGYAEDRGGRSPTIPAVPTNGGMRAEWRFENRNTRERIGIEMPHPQNAGAVAGRMAYAAPVSLFFFLTVLFTIILLKNVTLHPMHYLFISAGFFAFHILMAYLVDRIPLNYVFWICASVSVLLVVSYMRLVAGVKFAVLYVGLAQLVYLVGFSYAFTWQGNTGLAITIAAIVTLFILMQATGRLDWNEVFKKAPVPPHKAGGTLAPVPPGSATPPPSTRGGPTPPPAGTGGVEVESVP